MKKLNNKNKNSVQQKNSVVGKKQLQKFFVKEKGR